MSALGPVAFCRRWNALVCVSGLADRAIYGWPSLSCGCDRDLWADGCMGGSQDRSPRSSAGPRRYEARRQGDVLNR